MIRVDSKIIFPQILKKSIRMIFGFKNDYKNVGNVSEIMSGLRVFELIGY